jgi:hypothetical protein
LFDYTLSGYDVELLRPSKKNEKARLGEGELKAIRQLIESVNDTLKGQLDLERHGGRTCECVAVRVANASWPWPPLSGTTTRPGSR